VADSLFLAKIDFSWINLRKSCGKFVNNLNFRFFFAANNGSVVPGSEYAYNTAPYHQQYSTAYSYGYNGTSGSLLSK
jgi:hypothetical protein